MTDLIDGAATLSAVLKAHGIDANIQMLSGDKRMSVRLTGDQAARIAEILSPGINDDEDPIVDWDTVRVFGPSIAVATSSIPTLELLGLRVDNCAKCGELFDHTDAPFHKRARQGQTPYCRRCVDLCHDNESADHACVICRTQEPS